MEKLLAKIQIERSKQRELMLKMSKEKCDDIHSVLRAKAYADSIIELEVKCTSLLDAMVVVSEYII